jgi:hypothetical protein
MKTALALSTALVLLVSCRSPQENSGIKATAEITAVNVSHDTWLDAEFRPITEVSYCIITPLQYKGKTLTYGYSGFVDEKNVYVGKTTEIELIEEHLTNSTEP